MPPRIILAVDDSATIRKLVQVVLSRAGHEVRGAADGEEALRMAAEARPDLILLDFVMPKMNGYQFCRALAEQPALADVPVVLMSARGDEIGERFVRVMRIVDYISKPFSPEALIAIVERALAQHGTAAIDLAAGMDESLDDSRYFETLDTEATDTHEIFTRDARHAGGPVDAREALLREAIVRAVAEGDPDGEALAKRVRERLEGPVLSRLLVESGVRARPSSSELLTGQLARVPIAEVLSLLDQQLQSGALHVQRSGATPPSRVGMAASATARVTLCFNAGRIDYADADGLGEGFLLGDYLVRMEAIARPDLDLYFASRGETTKPCGEQLVALGQVSAGQVKSALARQTAERVFEALRWSSGRFALRALSPEEPLAVRANDAALGLTVDGLLMEGSRRLDEWHLIERAIDDFDAVFLRNEEAIERLPADSLDRDEQAVLDLVNARNSVRDIVQKSRLGHFEVPRTLLRLRAARLIRRRVPPVAV